MRRHTLLGIFFIWAVKSWGQIHVGGSLCSSYSISSGEGTQQSPTIICSPGTLFFDLSTSGSINSWQWQFGDGSFATERNATHTYAQEGTYKVVLQQYSNGVLVGTHTKEVEITDLPTPKLKGKQNGKYDEKCSGPLKLDPFEGQPVPTGLTYKWFPMGETSRTIEVEDEGCYSVEVTNKNGCSKIAQIQVKFCLANPNEGPSKKEWFMGNGAGIEFSLSPIADTIDCEDPTKFCTLVGEEDQKFKNQINLNPLEKPHKLNADGAIAMVYAKSGEMKLYADGKRVYDREGNLITGLMAGSTTTDQSTVIVPKATCNECPSHQYYVLTVNPNTNIMYYTLIDVRGGATVVQGELNIPLANNMAARLTATSLKEGGYGIIAHESNSAKNVVFKIDKEGISQVSSSSGSILNGSNAQRGLVATSPNSTAVALSLTEGGQNYIDIYKFDNATGGMTFVQKIAVSAAPPAITGICFIPERMGPDGNPVPGALPGFVYVSSGTNIYRFTLNTPSPAATKHTIATGREVAGIMLYEDIDPSRNELIVSYSGSPDVQILDFFDDPNGFPVLTTGGIMAYANTNGMPNITRYPAESDGAGFTLKYKGRCQGMNTIFTASAMCSGQGQAIYHWDFGDGETQTIPKLPGTIHVYKKAGKYNLKVRVQVVGCGERTYEGLVDIKPAPDVGLGSIVPYCDLPTGIVNLNLSAKATGGTDFIYQWKRLPSLVLGNDSTITLTKLDKYSVYVENAQKCSFEKEFELKRICQPEFYVPDVFTPNYSASSLDLTNEVFQFFPRYVSNLKIWIYDRWGNQVFHKTMKDSEAPLYDDAFTAAQIRDLFWNGKDPQEKDCPPGVYAYTLEYVEHFTIQKYTRTKSGSVLLIR